MRDMMFMILIDDGSVGVYGSLDMYVYEDMDMM